jgi:hypothetical protein
MAARLLMIAVCFMACDAKGDTIDDLGSPSAGIRAAAAKRLRDTYIPPAQSNWDYLVENIQVGDLKKDVLLHLKRCNARIESGMGSGPTTWEDYRLDDVWMLLCVFQGSGGEDRLISVALRENYRSVHVKAPADFTGVWTTYFVNGQPSHEVRYKNGKKRGVFTAFHADGSKSYQMYYGEKGLEGESVGYYPTGEIAYREQFADGVLTGPAIHYNLDGSVRK